VDAIEHLRRLVNDCVPWDPHSSYCAFCSEKESHGHDLDCPWLAAKAFVEEHDRPTKTPDQIRAEMDKIAVDSTKHGPPRHWGGY
jgi:hypothetical protein